MLHPVFPHSIKLDTFLAELANAMGDSTRGTPCYLDREAFEVISISESPEYLFDQSPEAQNGEELDESEVLPETVEPSLMDLDRKRFVPISPIPASDLLQEAVAFIEEIEDVEVQNALLATMHAEAPLQAFEQCLYEVPHYRKEWSRYCRIYEKQLAKEWLIRNGVMTPEALGEDPEEYAYLAEEDWAEA